MVRQCQYDNEGHHHHHHAAASTSPTSYPYRWHRHHKLWLLTLMTFLLTLILALPMVSADDAFKYDGQLSPCTANATCTGVEYCDATAMLCRCPLNGLSKDGTFHGMPWFDGNVTREAPCVSFPREVIATWKLDLFMFHGIFTSTVLLVCSVVCAFRIWNSGRRVAIQWFAAIHLFLYSLFYFIHYSRDPSANYRGYAESYILSYSPDLFLIALHNATMCYLRGMAHPLDPIDVFICLIM
jgi:hypothetical protein